ncbi:hypothetical protein EI94DRAFT_1700557 [Lactarius quietus]|nr:hypothetical protein EI94DRAFT_1700557 [Lactarius quietus]
MHLRLHLSCANLKRGSLAVSLALGESVGVRPATAGGDGGVVMGWERCVGREGGFRDRRLGGEETDQRRATTRMLSASNNWPHLSMRSASLTSYRHWRDIVWCANGKRDELRECVWAWCLASEEGFLKMCEEPRGQGEAKGSDVARWGKVGMRRVVRAGWEDQGGWAKGEGAAWWEDWEGWGNGQERMSKRRRIGETGWVSQTNAASEDW